MQLSKNHFYVHVSKNNELSFDVGPFEVSGGVRFCEGAIDWIYKQIGILKSQFPDAVLIRHRWDYKEHGAGVFGDAAVVDIKVEIAGFLFEIVPLKHQSYFNVIDELIERGPTVQEL